MAKLLVVTRSIVTRTSTIAGRIALLALVMILGASCGKTAAPPSCLQFSPDLMSPFAGGLIRKDFRLANAWAVKSGTPIDAVGVKVPAYFVSADIIAPNGEAVIGTWLTPDISKPSLMYSVSPLAQKYTEWTHVGDRSTIGITMETPGAKESASCVLTNRPGAPK